MAVEPTCAVRRGEKHDRRQHAAGEGEDCTGGAPWAHGTTPASRAG